MSKYWLIEWNSGYGTNHDVVEADSEEEANKIAYEQWREDAENQAEYKAEAVTSENLEDNGFDPEDYGLPAVDYGD